MHNSYIYAVEPLESDTGTKFLHVYSHPHPVSIRSVLISYVGVFQSPFPWIPVRHMSRVKMLPDINELY